MKWLKKTLNKWFFLDDVEEDYEDVVLEETMPEKEPIPEQIYIKEQKPKFRFPLIPDEELQPTNKEQTNLSPGTNHHLNLLPDSQQLKNSLVYDVEVSRIHELLEMRIQNKKKTTKVVHTKSIPKHSKRLVEKEITGEPIRIQKEKPIEKEKVQLPTNRRRFIPSDVPSPVYGFQKRQPINGVFQTKEKTTEQKVENENESLSTQTEEISATIEKGPSTRVVEELDKQIEKVKEEVEQILHHTKKSLSITIEEQQSAARSPSPVEEAAKENLERVPILAEPLDEASDPNTKEAVSEIANFDSTKKADLQESIETHNNASESTNVDDLLQIAQEEAHSLEEKYIQEEQRILLQNEPVEEKEFFVSTAENPLKEESIDAQANEQMTELENEKENGESFEESILEEQLGSFSTENIEANEQTAGLSDDGASSNEAQPIKEKKKKPIPFNVIMLKSDKEKLAKRLQSQMAEKEKNEQQSQPINEEHQQKPMENSSLTNEKKENEAADDVTLFQSEKKTKSSYTKPPLSILMPPETSTEDREWMENQAEKLVETLSYFQVSANVESIMQGPAVTQFEITVGHGTKVSKIRNLADDLKLALAAKDIRIQAPIPGKNTIGIEIPNRISRPVRLSEVVNSEPFLNSDSPLEAALGLDLTGTPITIDLRKMPHGLIAGATGSGKSVCINSILVSLLLKAEPSELRLMLIDPKVVELAPYNHIPHLVSPVITDVKAATAALKWAVDEMERRYQLFANAGVRDLPRYNKLAEQNGNERLKLPYILIVIDELADLMMMAPHDVEESICRIAQKARACGIHLILATQRPSVDVITGLIKSNIPTRIAFSVSSQIDSRTILDSQGAERLLGRGDMLYLGNGMSDPIRLQGTYVTDEEIEEIIEHVKKQGEPDYFFEQEELLKKVEMVEEQDELFEDVCRFVYEQGAASTSLIQRKYHIGYNRAARLIEMLESYGFVSEQKGSKPREVYITESDLAELFD